MLGVTSEQHGRYKNMQKEGPVRNLEDAAKILGACDIPSIRLMSTAPARGYIMRNTAATVSDSTIPNASRGWLDTNGNNGGGRV
jgi:hypothetical protein